MNSGENGLANPTQVYWDSCAWLGLVNGEMNRKIQLESIYSQGRTQLVEIWTSAVSIVEANRLKSEMQMAKPIPQGSDRALDGLLFQPFVKIVPVDTVIARTARKLLRETTGLRKLPDAIHLASALKWNIHTLHTYDRDDLLHLDGKMKCDDGEVLTICEPRDPNGGLFAEVQDRP